MTTSSSRYSRIDSFQCGFVNDSKYRSNTRLVATSREEPEQLLFSIAVSRTPPHGTLACLKWIKIETDKGSSDHQIFYVNLASAIKNLGLNPLKIKSFQTGFYSFLDRAVAQKKLQIEHALNQENIKYLSNLSPSEKAVLTGYVETHKEILSLTAKKKDDPVDIPLSSVLNNDKPGHVIFFSNKKITLFTPEIQRHVNLDLDQYKELVKKIESYKELAFAALRKSSFYRVKITIPDPIKPATRTVVFYKNGDILIQAPKVLKEGNLSNYFAVGTSKTLKIALNYARQEFLAEANIRIGSPDRSYNENLRYVYAHEINGEIEALSKIKGENIVESRSIIRRLTTEWVIKHKIVMKLYDQDLQRYLTRNYKNLSEKHKLNIAKQIFTGLQTIHRAGFFHRDIKPLNIFLDENRTIKIGDFGFAHRSLNVVGTREYLAPEIHYGNRDRNHAPRDVFAAGVVLFNIFMSLFYPYHVISTMNNTSLNILTSLPEPFIRNDQNTLIYSDQLNFFLANLYTVSTYVPLSPSPVLINALNNPCNRNAHNRFIATEELKHALYKIYAPSIHIPTRQLLELRRKEDPLSRLICSQLELDPSRRPSVEQSIEALDRLISMA